MENADTGLGLSAGDWVEYEAQQERTDPGYDLGRVVGPGRHEHAVTVRWIVCGETYDNERPRALRKLSADEARSVLHTLGRCACGHVLDRANDERCRHCARSPEEATRRLAIGGAK